jgi:16S rRNA (guanine(966)-N(2))-methyltransferase RsmD
MGFVKITSGRLKGRKVITPDGSETRPLLTRLRKSLADILRPRLKGSRVLDLFGGSGAIAFELISNGASDALVVEINPKTAGLIRDNSMSLGLENDVEILKSDFIDAAAMLAERGRKFDIIVVAPPYGHGLQKKALGFLGEHQILKRDGVVIVQWERGESIAETFCGLKLAGTRNYGRTVFEFYEETAINSL